jgi:hypothetical protein
MEGKAAHQADLKPVISRERYEPEGFLERIVPGFRQAFDKESYRL